MPYCGATVSSAGVFPANVGVREAENELLAEGLRGGRKAARHLAGQRLLQGGHGRQRGQLVAAQRFQRGRDRVALVVAHAAPQRRAGRVLRTSSDGPLTVLSIRRLASVCSGFQAKQRQQEAEPPQPRDLLGRGGRVDLDVAECRSSSTALATSPQGIVMPQLRAVAKGNLHRLPGDGHVANLAVDPHAAAGGQRLRPSSWPCRGSGRRWP